MLNNKKNIKQTVSTALSIMFLSQSLGSAKAKESFAGNTIIPQNRKIVKNINKKNLSFKEKLAKYLLGIGVPIAVISFILGIGIPLLKNKKPKQHQMNNGKDNDKEEEKKQDEEQDENRNNDSDDNGNGNDGCDDNKEKDNKEKDNKEKDNTNNGDTLENGNNKEKKQYKEQDGNSNNDSDDNEKQEGQQQSNQDDESLENLLNKYYDEKEIIETNPSKFLVCLSRKREINFESNITTEPYIIGQILDEDIEIEDIKLENLIENYNINNNYKAIRKILLGLADKINSDTLKEIAKTGSDNYINKDSVLEEWEEEIILKNSVKVCKLSVLKVMNLLENKNVGRIKFDESVNFVYIYHEYDTSVFPEIMKGVPKIV